MYTVIGNMVGIAWLSQHHMHCHHCERTRRPDWRCGALSTGRPVSFQPPGTLIFKRSVYTSKFSRYLCRGFIDANASAKRWKPTDISARRSNGSCQRLKVLTSKSSVPSAQLGQPGGYSARERMYKTKFLTSWKRH